MIQQIFQRIIVLIKRFFPQWRLYGFFVALWSFLYGFKHIWFRQLRLFIAIQKHKSILQYLSNRYSSVIEHFLRKDRIPESGITPQSVIWVCWWDGEETMPPLVKACFNSIRRHARKHPVQLVTKYNFRDFISIPEYVLEKFNTGIITLTHFSNIIRVNLLHDYGGIWIDSTVLVLKDIFLDNLPFYTLKTTNKTYNVSHIPLQGPFYTYTNSNKRKTPETNNWSGFLLAGGKHSLIFAYMRDILYAYWKEHNDQIDYLLYDYTIALGYGNIPTIKKLIDDVVCINYDKNEIEKNLNVEYSHKKFVLYSETFYKLTWKKKFNIYTRSKKLTIYGHLLNTYLE